MNLLYHYQCPYSISCRRRNCDLASAGSQIESSAVEVVGCFRRVFARATAHCFQNEHQRRMDWLRRSSIVSTRSRYRRALSGRNWPFRHYHCCALARVEPRLDPFIPVACIRPCYYKRNLLFMVIIGFWRKTRPIVDHPPYAQFVIKRFTATAGPFNNLKGRRWRIVHFV